jgi:zinc transporter, ZIP family
VLEAALWALLGAASLLLGVEIAFLLKPSRPVIGWVMAFGAGALISAVSFELVLDALESEDAVTVAIGLGAGAMAFFLGDRWLDRRGARDRKRSMGQQAEGSPLAIVLGAALDGVPESLIIGMSVLVGGGVAVSFVAATFMSNLPESMAATTGLQMAGWRRSRIWGLWLSVVALSVVSGAVGFAVFDSLPGATGAFVQAFAAGALLTMLADTMMPEAFEFGGKLVGLLTVAGFLVAVVLSEIS